jgi:hypothetical protein
MVSPVGNFNPSSTTSGTCPGRTFTSAPTGGSDSSELCAISSMYKVPAGPKSRSMALARPVA